MEKRISPETHGKRGVKNVIFSHWPGICQFLRDYPAQCHMFGSEFSSIPELLPSNPWNHGRDLQAPSVPAMGRDTFHYPGVLQAPSNLAWSTSRDGAALRTPQSHGKSAFLGMGDTGSLWLPWVNTSVFIQELQWLLGCAVSKCEGYFLRNGNLVQVPVLGNGHKGVG